MLPSLLLHAAQPKPPKHNTRSREREKEKGLNSVKRKRNRNRRGKKNKGGDLNNVPIMAPAILRSHDFLRDRFGPRTLYSSNPNPSPRINNASRCRRRKRDGSRRSSWDNISSGPAKGLVMGQVKILKRGEEFKPRMFFGARGDDDLYLFSTHRSGPDPEVVQKHIRVPDLYAGPTSLVSSPAPSELPFPSSLVRSCVMETDLRKLLKI